MENTITNVYRWECIIPQTFQHNMNDLFHGLEFIRAYIYEILILTNGYWKNHVHKLELTQNKLKEKVPKYNFDRSLFGHIEMEYLGLWFTHNGFKPINIKKEAITNMKPPTHRK